MLSVSFSLFVDKRQVVLSGKSTVVREIVKRLGNSVEKQTPLPHMLEDRRQFDDHLPVLFRRLYYSVGNYIASNEVRQILSTRPVVMDR